MENILGHRLGFHEQVPPFVADQKGTVIYVGDIQVLDNHKPYFERHPVVAEDIMFVAGLGKELNLIVSNAVDKTTEYIFPLSWTSEVKVSQYPLCTGHGVGAKVCDCDAADGELGVRLISKK